MAFMQTRLYGMIRRFFNAAPTSVAPYTMYDVAPDRVNMVWYKGLRFIFKYGRWGYYVVIAKEQHPEK